MSDIDLRPFPMMGGPPIPWFMAAAIYRHLYRDSQPLDQIARRGGFGWKEVEHMWGPKHKTTTEQCAACSNEVYTALNAEGQMRL